MDYGKSGAVKTGKNTPRHAEINGAGPKGKLIEQRSTKAELLERMKAAAKAKPKD